MGKCPKCEKKLLYVNIEPIDLKQGLAQTFHGASYICPHCQTTLSVSVDPLALKMDIATAVARGRARS